MAFKILEKGLSGYKGHVKPHMVSVGKSALSFGDDYQKMLNDFTHIEVYIDRDNKRIGLKPSNDGIKGFKLQKKALYKSRTYVNIVWLKNIAKGLYSAKVENGLIVFEVLEFADSKDEKPIIPQV